MNNKFSDYLSRIKNPYKRISSFFGPRRRFRTSNGQWSSSNHGGIDLPAPKGTTVPAMEDGVIESVVPNSRGGYGNFVVLRHSDGSKSLYAHLSSFGNIRPGMHVRKGTRLGGVGSTGNSTGNHLHFTLFSPSGNKINPLKKYSLNDFNRLASYGERSTYLANNTAPLQKKENLYASIRKSSTPNWWQKSMPSFLGGWSQEKKMAYRKKLILDRQIFRGITVGDLKSKGFSGKQIYKMAVLERSITQQNGLRARLGQASKKITYQDFRNNGFSKEETQTVMKLARNAYNSSRTV